MFEFEGRAVDAGLTREFREAARGAGLEPLLDRIMAGYLERTPSGRLPPAVPLPDARDHEAGQSASDA